MHYRLHVKGCHQCRLPSPWTFALLTITKLPRSHAHIVTTSYVITPMEVDSSRAKSADRMTTRQRRALSAIARPKTSALLRPPSATKPRRPYSAYSLRGAEDDTPKYDPPQSEREWWRYYVKVQILHPFTSVYTCIHTPVLPIEI